MFCGSYIVYQCSVNSVLSEPHAKTEHVVSEPRAIVIVLTGTSRTFPSLMIIHLPKVSDQKAMNIHFCA